MKAKGSVRPYKAPLEIVRAIIEDRRVMGWWGPHVQESRLILSDFDPGIDMANEYRVFVYRGQVKGICRYRWSEPSDWNDPVWTSFATRVIRFVEGLVIPALGQGNPSVTVDVIHNPECDNDLRLIEVNPFGGETGCGSGLFHWKRDEAILYNNDKDDVVVRVATRRLN
ncbi:hypothetical protein HK102_009994 [Quaeritorhiza haematococci]|nr:hypothetical protein HK102_009994 [Quaeritorhiza haematococci]